MALTLSELSKKLQNAVAHQNQGRAGDAAALYDEILADEGAILSSDASSNSQAVAIFAATNNNLGILRLTEGYIGEARVAFRRALDLAPGNLDALTNLALVKRHTGDREGAVESYKAALEIEQNYVPALIGLAQSYGETGRYDLGEELLQRACARLPGEVDLLAELANLLIPTGRGDEALQIVERALKLNPAHVGARYSKARALQVMGKLVAAISGFEKLVPDQPENAVLFNSLGLAKQQKGDREGAAASFQKAMLASPAFEHPHCNMAALHEQNEQIEDAKKITGEGLKRFPNSRHFLLLTAKFSRRDKKYEEALEVLESLPDAEADDQVSYEILSELACVHRHLENRPMADECQSCATALLERLPGIIFDFREAGKKKANFGDS